MDIYLATPSSPTAGDFFSHHQHLYPSGKTYYYWEKRVLWNRQSWNELLILIISGSQNFFPSPAKGQDFHLKSTEALINSETSTFRSENVSFSSLEVSHMIIISQSEASILVTRALSANQRLASWSHENCQPIRGKQPGHMITLSQSEVRMSLEVRDNRSFGNEHQYRVHHYWLLIEKELFWAEKNLEKI